ncbi:hypothetical protein ACFS5L_37785 [Streptomyces phyllanthi]|uniref:Membrane lipoprotein n=1 Tax=Streptomyces phyllanthi TaxID=1803180 RepID=A0A5N8W4E9_9ACTN|nr:hypothetical protein [Streptomyces phyllanthi]MPY42363.1 hypothetical protein [Streptomyces phyllanthi]
MFRAQRVLLPLALLPLLLTACGNEKVVVGASQPVRPVPDRAELRARAEALGLAPELVYVTEPSGFTLARQSVGVYGGDGFSSTYWSEKSGARFLLSVDRGTMTATNCPKQPVGQVTGEPVTCERDGDAWYRASGGLHEYAVPEKGHVVRVSGDTAEVGRDVLRAAAEAARRPTDSELAFLLPKPHHGGPGGPGGSGGPGGVVGPVERGDLPPVGDGAPNNEVGTTG